MTKLSKNMSLSEFACRDGSDVPSYYLSNVKELARRLQVLRDLIGTPIQITSGYRTDSHNAKVGGAKSSQHLTASAADIQATGWSPLQLALLWQGMVDLGLIPDGGLGVYSKWIHVDIGKPRRWGPKAKE
jgi:uncharacterized protein YcbK (DUF882 family)